MVRLLVSRIEAVLAAARRYAWLSAPLAVLALVLLSAFAYAPLFGGGMILTGDTSHAVRTYELGRCLEDGQLPCRWVPDLGNGYGYPLFNYYPPLPYYAGDLLHRLGLSYLRTVDVLFALGLVGAGVAMFALARRLWGDLGGLVSAVAYVYAPYLGLDVYMRGALAELWGLAFAPALLWAIYELVTGGRARYLPLVALFSAGLLLSHNLVAVIVGPSAALWAAAFLLTRGGDIRRPGLLAGAGALWGLGLAAFFTLPALTEGHLVQLDSLTRGPFHYSNHFASVSDLFLRRSADYSFLLGVPTGTPVQIGWFHWGLAALGVPAAFLLARAGRPLAALAAGLFGTFFAVGVFMSVSVSKPVWDAFDALRFLQFPWRYLGLVSLAAAAWAGAWLASIRGRPLALRAAVAAALVGTFVGSGQTFFEPVYRLDVSDADILSGERFAAYRASAIGDYLPEAVQLVPSEPPEAPARVVDGSARVRAVEAGSERLDLRVEATSPARIEAALFEFPNWRVRIDGEVVPHAASSPHGLISFSVPPGAHRVEVRLEDTGVRRLGNVVSLVSWSALVLAPAALLVRRAGRWPAALRLRRRAAL